MLFLVFQLDELQEKKRSVVGSRKFNKGEKEWEKEDGERRKNEKAKKKTDEQEKKKAELEKKRKEELEKKAAVKGKGREIVAATDDQVPKRSANTQSEAIQEVASADMILDGDCPTNMLISLGSGSSSEIAGHQHSSKTKLGR